MSAEEVAQAFVQHYYNTFDSNNAEQLSGLFVSSAVHTLLLFGLALLCCVALLAAVLLMIMI